MWSLAHFMALGSLLLVALGQDHGTAQPCVRRDFENSSFVCVCNETHCDTLPRPTIPPERQYILYSSDMNSKRFSKTLHNFSAKNDVSKITRRPCHLPPIKNGQKSVAVEFILDPSITFQEVIGWGGALSDSAAANILSLPEAAQNKLLGSYFSEMGSEYNLIRTNMGGCDFSWRPYSHADMEGDIGLINFSLQPEDTDYKIPVLHRIMDKSANPIKLFATPWSAPPWMKTNNDYVGIGQLKEEMYQVWAEYFVKFLDGYASQNITLWGLTLQNEPRVCSVGSFPFNCMGWTADQQRKWLAENLGPTLTEHGYDDLNILIMDDTRYEVSSWPQEILSDPMAKQYASGIAVHWYTDNWVSPDKLDEVHQLFPDIFILNTEACEGNFPSQPDVILGSWERAEHYARNIIENMNHWMNGWMDWNLALDMEGGPNWSNNFLDSSIIVDKETGEFYKNPMFYAMAHFSKFIKVGAIRIELSLSGNNDVDAVAFKNLDGSIAIVISNRLDSAVDVSINVEGKGTMFFSITPRSLNTALYL